MKKKLFSLIVFAISVSGCGISGNQESRTSEEVYQKTEVSNDPYTGTEWINGETIHVQFANIFLRCAIVDFMGYNVIDSPQLYIHTENYSKWSFYHSAYLMGGEKLRFTNIRKDVMGTTTLEDFGVSLEKKHLIKGKQNGLNIKLIGKNDEIIIHLPAYYVLGYMKKLDERSRQLNVLKW